MADLEGIGHHHRRRQCQNTGSIGLAVERSPARVNFVSAENRPFSCADKRLEVTFEALPDVP